MPGDSLSELQRLREEVASAMQERTPSRDFGAALIMATVWLHVIEARIHQTQNLEERRKLTNEFNNRRDAVCKGIRALQAVGHKSGAALTGSKLRQSMS